MSCDRLIDAEKAHHDVSRLARVLGVARARYYAWTSGPSSARLQADAVLAEQIRDGTRPITVLASMALLAGGRLTKGRAPPSPSRWGLLLSERDGVCLQTADRMASSEP